MTEITTIGLDLAKRFFQVHGVDAAGRVVLKRQLKRDQVVPFFSKLKPCLIGIEACGTSHYWAHTLQALGHEVRLIPPAYAKVYVRRNKTDPADAAAICEAVSRPSMRFVPVKSAAEQAQAAIHQLREGLVRQHTQLINQIRAHMAEFGLVIRQGPAHVAELLTRLDTADSPVPTLLHPLLRSMHALLEAVDAQIEELDNTIKLQMKTCERTKRLATIPGVGPLIASALMARVIQPERFSSGRDLSAWIGLVPKQNSSGGTVRLGRISKQGDEYLRRLLVSGAQAVLLSKRAKTDPWLVRLLATKPRAVAAVAVANKIARIAWAVMTRGTSYRQPAAT